MPTIESMQALADEADRIKARDAYLAGVDDGDGQWWLKAADEAIHRMMAANAEPEALKEWLTTAVDLHALGTSGTPGNYRGMSHARR